MNLHPLSSIALSVGVLLLSACGGTTPEPWAPLGPFSCSPGAELQCPCEDGGTGTALCEGGGASIGPCDCPEPRVYPADAQATDTAPWPPEDIGTTQPADAGVEPDAAVDEDVAVEPEPDGAVDIEDPSLGACIDDLVNLIGNEESYELEAWSLLSSCQADDDQKDDIGACVKSGLELLEGQPGLTPDCAQCFAEYAVCTASQCSSPCANYQSSQCVECREVTCQPTWEACKGI